jgi:hypothetical protein
MKRSDTFRSVKSGPGTGKTLLLAFALIIIFTAVTNAAQEHRGPKIVSVTIEKILIKIGDSYGGGIVAYLLQQGDPGYNSEVQHGLIAATTDQSTGTAWSNVTTSTAIITATAIGTGAANTAAIINQTGHTSSAAQICDEYSVRVGGVTYNDWYLPSQDEALKINENKAAAGWPEFNYWTSSEYELEGDVYGVFMPFDRGNTEIALKKATTYRVRAVRAF